MNRPLRLIEIAEIVSVKRKTDQEMFSVGDKVCWENNDVQRETMPSTILKFEICYDGNFMAVVTAHNQYTLEQLIKVAT